MHDKVNHGLIGVGCVWAVIAIICLMFIPILYFPHLAIWFYLPVLLLILSAVGFIFGAGG